MHFLLCFLSVSADAVKGSPWALMYRFACNPRWLKANISWFPAVVYQRQQKHETRLRVPEEWPLTINIHQRCAVRSPEETAWIIKSDARLRISGIVLGAQQQNKGEADSRLVILATLLAHLGNYSLKLARLLLHVRFPKPNLHKSVVTDCEWSRETKWGAVKMTWDNR